jgi:hypothetical protein
MFRVVRVWDNGERSTFRYTAAKFETKTEARAHRAKLQARFPNYVFWISEGNVLGNSLKLTKDEMVPMTNIDFAGEADPNPPWDD